jgi:hypothetical protein
MYVVGEVGGKVQFILSDSWGEMRGIPKYVLDITVVGKPPIVKTLSVMETRSV